MILFVDASAMVAIMEREPDASVLLERLGAASRPLWSAMSCWETIISLKSSYKRSFERARHDTEVFADLMQLQLVEVGEAERAVALDAFERYGKGQHRARLNMGDCCAYACAKTNDARLLYKGDDFTHTDMA